MKHVALLVFNFSVLEYLKGSGANDIVAVWAAAAFDTRQEAEDALPAIAAARDGRWDTREAIVFLQHSAEYLPSTQQAGRLFLSGVHRVAGVPDDYYSLASRGNKLWLPSEAATSTPSQSSGDQQRFLTDVPSATGTAPTITLSELKMRVRSVKAKLDAGDGSEKYRECVERTFDYEAKNEYRISIGEDGYFSRTLDQELASGLPSSSVVFEKTALGGLPNTRAEVWLEGEHANLFSVVNGDSVPYDFSGDGITDSIRYDRRIVSARPLPEGNYTTNYNRRDARFVPCDGYSFSHEWTITVTAPEDTLHEAFFDPVTDGAAVAADATNGILDPATFTDANSASATLERIGWESGTVKFELSSDDALAGQVANFIELDGTVSLSLNADAATVDAANDTLSWPVASQPWDDGDKLMLRIREAQGTCWNGTAVPNLSANPGLASDCTALLAAKDTIRGTAALNWSADTAITSWDGVTVEGTPSRVTKILLTDKSLNGTVPKELAKLTGLQALHLDENQLTGTIPTELGGLTALKVLRLGDNRLTGSIPTQLGKLTKLEVLNLSGNRLTGSIPSELGKLTKLESLHLQSNQLTGAIPTQLGTLANLETLWLSGNTLTGCIPAALRDVDDHDLTRLRLQYCAA